MILGLGTDIQEIARVEKAIKRGGVAFLKKAFTPAEVRYCRSSRKSAERFAARFCAKEAFFKALGTGWARGVAWTDVEVRRRPSGAPWLKLSGQAQTLVRRAGVKTFWLSLSHSSGYAAATVILEG
jgi:holo-[acyl-carrier protein] synthase